MHKTQIKQNTNIHNNRWSDHLIRHPGIWLAPWKPSSELCWTLVHIFEAWTIRAIEPAQMAWWECALRFLAHIVVENGEWFPSSNRSVDGFQPFNLWKRFRQEFFDSTSSSFLAFLVEIWAWIQPQCTMHKFRADTLSGNKGLRTIHGLQAQISDRAPINIWGTKAGITRCTMHEFLAGTRLWWTPFWWFLNVGVHILHARYAYCFVDEEMSSCLLRTTKGSYIDSTGVL